MIQLQSVGLLRGPRQLLNEASLAIHAGDKIGLIGANGSGKSSLFQLLLGVLHCDSGHCQVPKAWRIGHMLQEIPRTSRSAIDFVIDGDQALRQIQQAIEQHQDDDKVLADLYAQLEEADGYSAEARAARLLDGLCFQASEFQQPLSSFSGGWRVRLALAQALMCPSDLLLLDEPTNHLDLSATLWLEQWLKSYPGTLVIVSHDRDFLDRVVTGIVHIEHQQLVAYRGNYSSFEQQRAARIAQQQARYEKQQQRVAEINNFVRRFRAKATKARQAQSRLKELQRMEQLEPAHFDSPFHFRIPCAEKVPQTLISLNHTGIGYDHHVTVNDVNMSLLAGSRVGLLGANGAGKSTLLKSLAGDLPLVNGQRIANDGLQIGYFAQHQLQSLDLGASPALHIQRLSPTAAEQQIRTFLGGFDFQGDRVFEPIQHFSGGEKARLTLALIAWCKPNLLILDEPTNHLDLDMRHALTVALQDYQGAVIIVSHDRHLLRNTVEELWLVANGTLQSFDGDLDNYERWLSEQPAQQHTAVATQTVASTAKKQMRQQAAASRATLKPLTDNVRQLEKQLEKLSTQQQALQDALAAPELYEADNKAQLQLLLKEQSENQAAMSHAEELWLNAQEQLERYQRQQ